MSDEARRPRPSLVDNDIVFNVALGSNMDGEKLRARATSRDGKNIEPLGEGVACRIEDWELSFQYLVLPPTEPVMAGAVDKSGGVLHGVLWKLTKEDYQALAHSEGCFWEHPIYEEREVLAIPYEDAAPVRAIVFALRSPDHVPPYLYPSERYKGMMVKGACGANLAPEFVHQLEKLPTSPPVSRIVLGVSLLAATALFYCWKSKRRAPLVHTYYTPVLARVYSAREAQIRQSRALLAKVVTAAMLLIMLPFVILGFFRFIYLGRDMNKILSGR